MSTPYSLEWPPEGTEIVLTAGHWHWRCLHGHEPLDCDCGGDRTQADWELAKHLSRAPHRIPRNP